MSETTRASPTSLDPPHCALHSLGNSLFSPSSVMAAHKITSKKSDLKPITIGPLSLDESDTDQDESEDDEEGLERLMNALGEDGLDEYDLAQLRMLTGSAAGEESDEEEGHDGDGEEDDVEAASASEDEEQVEEEEKSGEKDEIALDDEDVGSVDEDVIPRRKVEVDNKVASSFLLFHLQANLIYG
jgi:hypothetical protein